jgi:DNA-binding MarR family transcriptional regulator
MTIERDQRDRMELELAGYRSAKWLGAQTWWLFSSDNMVRALKANYFERVNNGTEKASFYYKLTPKGKAELRKAGPGFTYGDAQGRTPISFQQGDSERTRWIKVSPKARREEADKILAAFKELVTADGAHDQLSLQKEGWFPSKTTRPPDRFIEAGIVERMQRGEGRLVSYFRLTPKGKKALVAASLKKLLVEQAEARRVLRAEQATTRRRLSREINVTDWVNLP